MRSLLTKALHRASHKLSSQGGEDFELSTYDVQTTQREKLKKLLQDIEGTESAKKHNLNKASTLEEFQDQVPVTDYEYWHDLIQTQQQGQQQLLSNNACDRYQPTSGSTSKIKWIPYNQPFLEELDDAIGPWVSDLYSNYPGIKQGKHYWSLSWVPSDLRDKMTSSINDDLQLLPWWKRLFMAGTMAVPESLSLAKSSDDSFFATACYLASCRDLSFISVWSPTFALSILQLMQTHRRQIVKVLGSGSWPSTYTGLQHIKAPKNMAASDVLNDWDGDINARFTQKLWPKLALISAWDTSSSKIWAQKLKELFPHSAFQGKGLWATEGVISIPLNGQYPLSINSHFYEFEDLDNKGIFTSWQLKIGQNVRPVISTGNGLLRYAMKDHLRVTGFINQCPCLEFIGRLDGVDMVGEKLAPEVAVELINYFSNIQSITPISLLALPSSDLRQKPAYSLLCGTTSDLADKEKQQMQIGLSQQLEEKLCQHFHYKLARELGQLDSAEILILPDAMEIYASHKISRGMVAGNIKIEPLVLWQSADPSTQHSDQMRQTA